ncbi:MAG: iron-containing alcohol dehydrogenase, partial [Myxococcales bacterium]|nr:iron-containing alcohol dehydrogenase [Myxococcales bacterium]
MSNVTTYNFPTRIRFGAGARHELGSVLSEAGVWRPSIVTDRGIARLDWFKKLVESLGHDFEVNVFSDFEGNPIGSHVMAGVASVRSHAADAIIAVGGGAAIDVAKAIAA